MEPTPGARVANSNSTGGLVHFLPRHNYEGYLLNPDAIAALINKIQGFSESGTVSRQQIAEWIEQSQWNASYVSTQVPQAERSPEGWLAVVDGAKLLEDLFTSLSNGRVTYQKVHHGEALTRWLIDNSPEDLADLANWLGDRIA